MSEGEVERARERLETLLPCLEGMGYKTMPGNDGVKKKIYETCGDEVECKIGTTSLGKRVLVGEE